jgi:hypothetical protein
VSPIPISAARQISEVYGYDQVIVVGRRINQPKAPGNEHVTTYGVDAANCAVAARIGDFLKYKIMGWLNGMKPKPPVPEDFDKASADRAAELFELLARAECRRQGIAPDENIADGGHVAWQLVGYEAAMKEKVR